MSYLGFSVAVSERVYATAGWLSGLLAQVGNTGRTPSTQPGIPGLSREATDEQVTLQEKEFWDTAFGNLIQWLAGIGAVALFVWGVIKGVMEVAKGRGGGITGILRQVMPMFLFAALLTMLTTLPGLVIGILVAPITWFFDLINTAIGESQT